MQPSYRATALLFAALGATTLAHATTVSYQGTVSDVLIPSQAHGVAVGDDVTFTATFDPSKLVDISSSFYNIDGASGLPVSVPGLKAVSLADDPTSSYTVTIGTAYTFTEASDYTVGQDYGLGAGNFPLVVYNGSQLLGIDGGAQAADGLQFDFDPIAYMLHYRSSVGEGYGDASSEAPSFLVTTELDGAIRAATAVPEPSTWALMLAGVAGICFSVVRRRELHDDSV